MRKRDCAISIRVFRGVDEKMETLVGYASEESENSPQLKRETEEDKPDTRADTQQAPCANLAAEWEAFESLLGGSAFTAEASTSALLKGVPQPVAAPSCSTSGVPTPVCAAPKKEKSRDEEASLSSSEGSDSSSGRSSKRARERRRQRNSSKGKIKSRVSRSSSSDSDSSNSSYSPSRATADVGDAKKQRLQRSDSSSDDSDSEQNAHSTDSSDSNSPERPRRTFKSSDSEASVDNDMHKDLTSTESNLEKSGSVSPDSKFAGEVGELRCSPRQTDVSASPSREVTLMDRLLKIAEENCTGEVSKADVVCRAREPSSSRSPSPHKRRELKGRHRSSRSRSREKGRRRGGRRRRSKSWEHSRRRRGHRSRSGSHHRRSGSRRRATSRSSVTKSPSKERSRRLSSTTDDCKDTTKSEHKKSRSRSRSRQHRSRSRGRRSRSRGRRSRSRGRRSRSRGRRSRSRGHRRSRSRGRRSRSRDVRSKKRGRRYSPAQSHAFEGHSRGWKKKRPLEKGRNCMMRSPSRSPSRQKARLYKLLKQTAPPEKRLTFKESLLQQLMKMQKDASAGNLMFDPSAIEALESANEKPSSLPLNSSNPLLAMMMAAGGDKVTPQQALLQTMAAMHQKAQELTGVAVPKYYNPAAVNPLKYAEQMQKRKLLWSKVKTDNKEEGAATWGGTSFSQDQDGKVAHKFRKLMGMKEGEEEEEDDRPANEEQQLKQQQLFDQLDKEYEFARMTTHTHRGIGLGFQSLGLPDN